jgi:quinohemoprotein ethanol dehydrogenase
MVTSKSSWDEVVLGGALTERGMIGWSKLLNPTAVDQVRAYVGEMARTLQQQGRK